MLLVTRRTIPALIARAKRELERDDLDLVATPTVEQAINHYLGETPGDWRLIAVTAVGEAREFYWATPDRSEQ
jgi:hypothetical protein